MLLCAILEKLTSGLREVVSGQMPVLALLFMFGVKYSVSSFISVLPEGCTLSRYFFIIGYII